MNPSEILMLSMAGLLAAFFCILLYLRTWRTRDSYWTGHGIDVSGISERLRRMHQAQPQFILRSTVSCHHRTMLPAFRRAIIRLGYFQNRSAARTSSTPREAENADEYEDA